MKTYQDWLEVADRSEEQRMEFILAAINDHKGSQEYQDAVTAEEYYNGENTTIKRVQKFVYNAMGQAIPDYISANHKLANRFFYRSITQATQVLLGNGITWKQDSTEPLGKDFDKRIIQIARAAQTEGTCFGFWNLDHVDIFELRNFKPLYDEEDGALKAGIRFWQIDDEKPMRATMYEIDGYTEYRYEGGKGEVLQPKRPYILKTVTTVIDGLQIYDGENYPTFPVVPCYANSTKTSELNPIRATIDAYDLISSDFANDADANVIFWTITNAGGMDDQDLITFLNKLRKNHIGQLDDDQDIQMHTAEIPFQGKEAILERLEKQLYKDAMALNTYDIANGAVTATQIEAAYEPLNQKLDQLESYITDFIDRLLKVAGVEDEPTYTRSIIVNRTEEINSLVSAALYLDEDYITEKIMTLYGDKDKVQDVLDAKAEENTSRMTGGSGGEDTEV